MVPSESASIDSGSNADSSTGLTGTRWRSGLRYDQLASGHAEVGAANAANVISSYAYTPVRYTLMFDYSPSEFSRLRLQLAQDKSREGLSDNQLFLQYVMSLGAHGAHAY